MISHTADSFTGVTASGERFQVPELPSVVSLLLFPKYYDISTFFIFIFGSFSAWVAFSQRDDTPSWLEQLTGYNIFPRYNIIVVALFWRFCYNILLGFLLRWQSENQFFTRHLTIIKEDFCSSEKPRLVSRITALLLNRTLPDCLEKMPASFSAWVVSRYISNIILCCEVISFSLCVICCWEWSTGCFHAGTFFCLETVLCYTIGAILCVTSLWSKSEAHTVIGAYAWYWGDFFFLAERDLIFDGIFELFPHPMYTIGYGWTYGAALLSRSYVVFSLAVVCHIFQMIFLHCFEEPHIEKIYGKQSHQEEETKNTNKKAVVSGANVFGIKNFDIYRSSDINLVLFIFATCAIGWLGVNFQQNSRTCGGTGGGAPCIFPFTKDGYEFNECTFYKNNDLWCSTSGSSEKYIDNFLITDGSKQPWGLCNCGRLGSTFFIVHALFWRCANSLGLGYVLYWQGKNRFFSRHFLDRGKSEKEAFDSWKRLYNLINSMTILSFLMCAVYFFRSTYFEFKAKSLAILLASFAMMGLQLWSYISCYNVLGDFGWFFGDFFIKSAHQKKLSYTGIYRYWNNPLATFGFLGFYGVALLCASAPMLAIAVASHALHLLFLIIVEQPHVKAMYKNQFRFNNPLDRKTREFAQKGLNVITDNLLSSSPEKKESSPRSLMRMLLPKTFSVATGKKER
eukprot:g6443.t1